MNALRAVVRFLGPIACAHLTAFVLIGALPDPEVSALGLWSANPQVRQSAQARSAHRGYGEVLRDLLQGDLGQTLDQVAVATEIGDALCESGPRLALSFLLIAATTGVVALLPGWAVPWTGRVASLFAFLPPFVVPFVGVGLLMWARTRLPALSEYLWGWACSLAITLPGAALAASQTAEITQRNLNSPFATTLRALGTSRIQQRIVLLHNLTMELAPTLEKLAIGLLTAALFAEPTFGLGGIGTLLLRAIRRNDVALLLGVVLASATVVGTCRLASTAIRRRYGLAA